ncbi:MAG: hypothetical protein SFY69_08075 [Planctomycetota bacterium]|nr:hypothetical protein [Planctomycetota bacterium]
MAGLVACVASSARGQSFQLVGLPQGYTGTLSAGVSADGSVVAGWSTNSNGRGPGWSWTADAGRIDLTGPGFQPNTGALGISGDGRYLVGRNGPSPSSQPATAYRYDRETGVLHQLGVLESYTRSVANDASFDGSVVVGTLGRGSTIEGEQAFRWTPSGGMQPLGFTRPGEHFISQANAVSADGNTVVGESAGFGSEAFVWTSELGMRALPPVSMPNAGSSIAFGMNADASIIVGLGGTSGRHPIRWQDGLASNLGLPTGFVRGSARATSDDGSVIVGQVVGGANVQAAIWTPQTGPIVLSEYLGGIGVQLPPGLTLYNATGVSADGLTIVGYTTGTVGQGFVITIPAPTSLIVFTLVPAFVFRRRSRS